MRATARIRRGPPPARRKDKPLLYDLLWPEPGKPLWGAFLVDQTTLIWAETHWDLDIRRTVLCPGIHHGCGHCQAKIGKENKYWLGVYDHKRHQVYGLVLGESSYRLLVENCPLEQLRGRTFVAKREHGPTSKVRVDLHAMLPVDAKFDLPECPDLASTLEYLHKVKPHVEDK